MKKIPIRYLFLTFLGFISLRAQSQVLTSCKSNNLVFSAKKVEGLGILYYVTDSINNKTDSLLLSGVGWEVKNCFCNDTLASFYVWDFPFPIVEKFQLKEGKWKYMRGAALPQIDVIVGILEDGKQYEVYTHELVAIDKVISKLTILKANGQRLIPIEKYRIEYRISKENELILEKKTPLKE